MLSGGPGAPAKPRWRGSLLALAILLVIGFVLLRLRGGSFRWDILLSTLYQVNWIWLVTAMLLTLLTYVGRAVRWEVMLRPLGRRISIRTLTYDTAIGFTAATLLGRVGELVRPYLISVSAGVPFSSQLGAWLLERLLDLLAVLLLFGYALTRVSPSGLGPGLRWAFSAGGYIAGIVGALCVLLLIVFRNFSQIAERRILAGLAVLPAIYYQRSSKLLHAFIEGLQAVRDLRSLVLLGAYTVAEWALIVASLLTLFRACGATASLKITDVVIMLGFLAFASLIQIPGIGGGVQVVSILVLTEMYGLSVEAASGVAILIWALSFGVIVPFGLACAFQKGWNWRKLKQLSFQQIPEQELL